MRLATVSTQKLCLVFDFCNSLGFAKHIPPRTWLLWWIGCLGLLDTESAPSTHRHSNTQHRCGKVHGVYQTVRGGVVDLHVPVDGGGKEARISTGEAEVRDGLVVMTDGR